MEKKISTYAEYMAQKARAKELEENPVVRTPVAILLDISGSMVGEPIKQVCQGARALLRELLVNSKARDSVELCIMTFDYEVNCIREFCTVKPEDDIPELETRKGTTCTGSAVHATLDRLVARKNEYKAHAVEYYQPMLVLITDGSPYGEDKEVTESAIKRIEEMVNSSTLSAFTVGVGDDVEKDVLQRFSPGNAPLHVGNMEEIQTMFKWIGVSAASVANNKAYHAAPENICSWNTFRP